MHTNIILSAMTASQSRYKANVCRAIERNNIVELLLYAESCERLRFLRFVSSQSCNR